MRPSGRQIGDLELSRGTPQVGYEFQELPEGIVEVTDLTKGMVTSLPRKETTPESGLVVRNARTRQGWVGRRPGTRLYENAELPDGNPVLKLVTFMSSGGAVYLLRITRGGVHIWSVNGWKEIAGYSSPIDVRISVTQTFNRMFFTDGRRPWMIDFDRLALTRINDAPYGQFVTGFGDRLLVANIISNGTRIPNGLAWSENLQPTRFSGLSAGQGTLMQGSSDFSDDITGIFGMEQEAIILRKRSIWVASRQAFASNPFRFVNAIAGYGCDLPYTAVQVPGGVIYADQFTKGVYFYQIGGTPQKISGQIEDDIFEDLWTLQYADASFDPYENEYHLGLTYNIGGDTEWISRTWVYALKDGAWSYDDGPKVSTIGVVTTPSPFISIDDLLGVIDTLPGTIDSLGGSPFTARPVLFKGTQFGEVLEQTYQADDDHDGTAFMFEFQTQNLGALARRRTIIDQAFQFESPFGCEVRMAHRRGKDQSWKNEKIREVGGAQSIQSIKLGKTKVSGDDLYLRIQSSMGQIRVRSFWLRFFQKGIQRGHEPGAVVG